MGRVMGLFMTIVSPLLLLPTSASIKSQEMPKNGHREYELYGTWLNAHKLASSANKTVHILDHTVLIDPLKLPCDRRDEFMLDDSIDYALWGPLSNFVQPSNPLSGALLSKYVDPVLHYALVSQAPADDKITAIAFSNVTFREERSEAVFVVVVRTGKETAHGQNIFARRIDGQWRLISICDFTLKGLLAKRSPF